MSKIVEVDEYNGDDEAEFKSTANLVEISGFSSKHTTPQKQERND